MKLILHYIIHILRFLSQMNTLFFHLKRPNNIQREIFNFILTPYTVVLEKNAWKEILNMCRYEMIPESTLQNFTHWNEYLQRHSQNLSTKTSNAYIVNKLYITLNSLNSNLLSICKICSTYFYRKQKVVNLKTIYSIKCLYGCP